MNLYINLINFNVGDTVRIPLIWLRISLSLLERRLFPEV